MPLAIASVSLLMGVFLESKRTHLMLPGYVAGLGKLALLTLILTLTLTLT
jgi:hypothetical protein